MLILLAFFINLSPTTLIKVETAEVFKRAAYIVSAYVKDAYCELEYNKDYAYIPYSYITLTIDEIHHNSKEKPLYLNQDIIIRQVGCSMDYKNNTDIILEFDGLASFTLNTKIFISLNSYKNSDFENYYYVTANEQGKLDYDSNNTLIQDLDHSKYVRRKDGSIKFINTSSKLKYYSKNSLLKLIEAVKGE